FSGRRHHEQALLRPCFLAAGNGLRDGPAEQYRPSLSARSGEGAEAASRRAAALVGNAQNPRLPRSRGTSYRATDGRRSRARIPRLASEPDFSPATARRERGACVLQKMPRLRRTRFPYQRPAKIEARTVWLADLLCEMAMSLLRRQGNRNHRRIRPQVKTHL